MGLALGYLLLAVAFALHAAFFIVTLVALRGAIRQQTRSRYFPALFCGLVVYACMPLVMSALVWTRSVPGATYSLLFEAPSSIANGLARVISPNSIYLGSFMGYVLSVSWAIGLGAAVFLLATRKQVAARSAAS